MRPLGPHNCTVRARLDLWMLAACEPLLPRSPPDASGAMAGSGAMQSGRECQGGIVGFELIWLHAERTVSNREPTSQLRGPLGAFGDAGSTPRSSFWMTLATARR